MARTLFTNVTIIDGSGAEAFAGEVLVEGNRIKSVARGRGTIAADGAERVDGGGATLMPGTFRRKSTRCSPRGTPS